jgi:hypothetical protein
VSELATQIERCLHGEATRLIVCGGKQARHDKVWPRAQASDPGTPIKRHLLDEETRLKLRRDKQARHAEVCRRAQVALEDWMAARV